MGLNKFFDKIYVINLFDKTERWKRVSKQFKNRNIDVERFVAVDGRCKDQGLEACKAKLKTFEIAYDVKISNKRNLPLQELVPASALTIGTILILRHMVKHKLQHILICEDDLELGKDVEKKFDQGIKELKKSKYDKKWDILYLGCGNRCGDDGVSRKKTKTIKHKSLLSPIFGEDFYTQNKDDLRMPCDEDCDAISEHLSIADHASGSWCYAFSLKGAKKMLKLINNDAGNHIDHMYQKLPNKGGIVSVAFNPPIVWHREGLIRSDTDIPWI